MFVRAYRVHVLVRVQTNYPLLRYQSSVVLSSPPDHPLQDATDPTDVPLGGYKTTDENGRKASTLSL